MRFSLRWLREYLHTDLPAERIIELVTECGLEVEQVLDLGMIGGKLVVGELLEIKAIEGAEKIRLTSVNTGGEKPLSIVCGAQNIAVGQKVPVALFGMKFPDGMELKPRKIMGIAGDGMLCSAKELGVAEDAAGIWILPESAKVGEPWDAIVEISVTANRPDALSIVGIARDLCAKINATKVGKAAFRMPEAAVAESAERADQAARVTIQAKDDCPRYAARVAKGVKVGPSPRWMQVVLESAGLRAINNLVDATNFVMLELGQPLHAFDLDKVMGAHIIVRNAQPNETLTTLDGQDHILDGADLLICDAERPVALAGIMGGGNSEIDDSTRNVLLESAYFRPQTVRRTAKRLEKSTDASYRFERTVDAQRTGFACTRAMGLIAETSGATVLKGMIDAIATLPERPAILLRLPRLAKLLGYELTGREVNEVLTHLGFEILRSDGETMSVKAPSSRPDINIEADCFEEVARVLGYDRIREERMMLPSASKEPTKLETVRARLVESALAAGFCQAINFSFVSEGANAFVGKADGRQVRVQNPLTVDQGVMRRSVLPSLLANVAHNLNQSVEDVALFELGSTYEFESAEAAERDRKEAAYPAKETPMFAAILSAAARKTPHGPVAEADFFAMKGHAENILAALGIAKAALEPATDIAWLHPGRAARFTAKNEPIIVFGEVHPALLKELDIKKRVVYLEMALEGAVLEASGAVPKYKEIPRFPAVVRDVAVVVDRAKRAQEMERTIKKAGKELLAGVRLFDVYEGDKIAAGKKQLAWSLTFRAADRTLKDAEVSEVFDAIVAGLGKDHGAALRS